MSRRMAEIAFALVTAFVGIVMIVGARDLDTGWGASGPEAGFFPLRVGIVIVAVSLLVLASEALRVGASETFIDHEQARAIAAFLLPLTTVVMLTPWLGLYVAAAIYLLVTVGGIGRAGWAKAAAVSICVPVLTYMLFERVFLTPLPKGLLEPLMAFIQRAVL